MINNIAVNSCLVLISFWIIRRYLDIIFERREKINIFGILSWGIAILFQAFAEYTKGIPSLVVLFVNIVLVLLVCMANYNGRIQKKIVFIVLLHIIWMVVESGLYQILTILPVANKEFAILGSVISKIIMIFLVMVLHICIRKKENKHISIKYVITLLLVPISSIFIVHNIFGLIKTDLEQSVISLISFMLILLINITIFEVYARLSENFGLQRENLVFEQQFELMNKHIQEREVASLGVKELRHDLKSHLIYVMESIEHNRNQKALDYIKNLVDIVDYESENIAQSGNTVVDSLINFKCAAGTAKGITITSDLFIPAQLPIRDTDLCIILGNALDNAIEAACKCSEKKIIEIFMGCKKNALSIVINNSFIEATKKDWQGNFVTTKKDWYNHGMGIVSIKKAVDRYDGELVMEVEENTFSLMVLLNL